MKAPEKNTNQVANNTLLEAIEWPPTNQLLHLLWDKPATHIAGDLGCCQASVLIRAKDLGLPKPGHGYWQKKTAGVEVEIPPEVKVLMAKLDAEALGAKENPILGKRRCRARRRSGCRPLIAWPSAPELLCRLWTEPATHIALGLGCKYGCVLARAKALRLPTPGNGYWQKKNAGIPVGIPAEAQALMAKLGVKFPTT